MSRKLAKKKQAAREPFPIEQFWGSLEEQRRREVLGVLFTAASLTVFLSLISYPIGESDSWRTLITDTTSNLIGTPGNLVAWTLFFLTGLYVPESLELSWGHTGRMVAWAAFYPLIVAEGTIACLYLLIAFISLLRPEGHSTSEEDEGPTWMQTTVVLLFALGGALLVMVLLEGCWMAVFCAVP